MPTKARETAATVVLHVVRLAVIGGAAVFAYFLLSLLDSPAHAASAVPSPALAQALLRLWRNPDEGQRLGRAGRDRVESHFDIRRMVAQYERLYLGSINKELPKML